MRDEAIVLHVRPYGDADAVVALFARTQGRVTLFARGARSSKRKETPLVPLHEITLELARRPGSELHAARTIHVQQAHMRLREDLKRLAAANVLLELLSEMFRDGEHDERIYAIAVHTLAALEDATADPVVSLLAFEHTLLVSLGIGDPGKSFTAHTRAFEELHGKPLPARDFFLSV